MATQYYLVRARMDGRYLTAHPQVESDSDHPSPTFLLLFQEHYDALSYLNTHASGLADQFAVESITNSQVGNLLERWGFNGVGMVRDPLVPRVEFLTRIVS